ncbi:MAG: ATP-binding protein, partial [Deltaproteobacteria bacterium]|nr:ATP-binding protein [Deltaproteobacteria bacterium]
RDCQVQGQLPLFTELEALEASQPEDRERAFQRQVLLDAIESYPGLVLLTTSADAAALQLERPLWCLALPIPQMDQRELLWRCFLGSAGGLDDGLSLREVADLYPLTGGLIRRAAETAVSRAASRGAATTVSLDDVRAGVRSQLAHRLRSVAEYIEPHGSWEDVVVPKETAERLQEMVAFFRHRRQVWESWDFRSKFSTLRGVSSLFYGPPGTGKSFTAGVMAAQLGMDLFRVDLSQVVSKWIGETEKNLGRVFDEAARGHVVLFFDEADSLFTKRTEVSSSVDRYANLEVNYLLQRMERYEGVTILATNHEGTLDPAFKRRLSFRIQFPQPEQEERRRLWQTLIPEKARMVQDVDWDYLAEAFEMSGGHIRNAIVRAAFRAADQDAPIDGELLAAAAAVEYEEMGRLIRR